MTTGQQSLLLWDDFQAMPADWQKKTVSDHNLYWISVTVSSSFATAPVGTQITTIPNLKAVSAQV
jgi:hypothetical protein